MTDIRNTSDQFFGARNEAMLDRLLYADFQRRTGGDLSERQKERLTKTVRHYMQEVQTSNPTAPVQLLNKEVLTAVVPDFMSYLRRTGPKEDSELQMDVSSRFDRLQQDRQGAVAMPTAPDFQVSLESDGPSPLSRFEEIKKIREAEALREAEVAAKHRSGANTTTSQELILAPRDSSMNQFVDSDVSFKAMADAAKARDAEALGARGARPRAGELMPVPPDARQLFIGNGLPVPARTGQANPTLAMPTGIRDRPVLAQDVIKPQEDIVSYRENEYNLYVYSADRDWVNNSTENRYNFSVQLNGGATPQGRGYQATLMNRLKNIVRLEFIKAILPVEGLEVVVPRACDPSGTDPVPESAFVSVLSNPFIQVLLDEQTGNNVGTNDVVDRSLAICQYDATWKSDQTHDPTHSRGYTLFFPKFMKAQRIFAPTPLASLQNLHFQMLNPEGQAVSCLPDSLNVSHILYSNAIDVSGTCYYDLGSTGATAQYLFIQTSEYFPIWSFSKYDRITFAGLTKPSISAHLWGLGLCCRLWSIACVKLSD
jgi:hypothetical protein